MGYGRTGPAAAIRYALRSRLGAIAAEAAYAHVRAHTHMEAASSNLKSMLQILFIFRIWFVFLAVNSYDIEYIGPDYRPNCAPPP